MACTLCGHVLWACLLLHVIKYSSSDLIKNTACSGYKLTADSCKDNEIILPRLFTLGISRYNQCHDSIQDEVSLRIDKNLMMECCQERQGDHLEQYCLPSEISLSSGYSDFLSECTGASSCTSRTNVGSENSTLQDYATLGYACIIKDTLLHMNSSGNKTSETEVYLYNDQSGGDINNITCIGYTNNCSSQVRVSTVASKIAGPKCSVMYQDGNTRSTINCKNLTAVDDCSPTFNSTSNYVIMSVTMVINPEKTKEYLWLKVAASGIEVVCGSKSKILESIPSCSASSQRKMSTAFTTMTIDSTTTSAYHSETSSTKDKTTKRNLTEEIKAECGKVSAIEVKIYYIYLAASALGGVVLTGFVWCMHARSQRKKRKKQEKIKEYAQRRLHR